jgi:hypothetical protein
MQSAVVAVSVALAVVAAGCGSSGTSSVAQPPTVAQQPPPPAPVVQKKKKQPQQNCTRSRRAEGFRMCAGTIERRVQGHWKVVVGIPQGGRSRAAGSWVLNGSWRAVWLSPDGKTLLAQWSAECETRYAFFAPASGGRSRTVTGELNYRKAPESQALGWAEDGRARVFVIGETGCGGREWQTGEYLIDPAMGDATFVHS